MPGLRDDDLTGPDRTPPSEAMRDLLDLAGRRLAGAILGAGALIGIGLYAGGGTDVEAPRYQIIAQDGEVLRLNTESGTIIACNGARCMRVLDKRMDDDLAEGQGNSLFKTPPAAALPTPAQQQSAPVAQGAQAPSR